MPICCGCGIYVTDEVRALQCDRCQASEGWKCTDCLNISKTMYESLIANTEPNLKWFCDECDVAVMDVKVAQI